MGKAVGPSLGWDIHPKMIWCADMSGMDSPDPWEVALFGYARLFQGAYVCRVMEEDWIRAWNIVKVTYEDPASALFSGGGAVSLAL